MHDRRIARGSTYAAMVIPAGTNPDAMMMEKRQEDRKAKSFKKNANVCCIFTYLNSTVIIGKSINTSKNKLLPRP